MKRVNIFLIAVTLIAGMMGCQPALYPAFDPFPPPGAPLTYALNISSTAGGSVTATVNEEDAVIGPGETVTIYDIPAGTKVDLLASPDEGYEFVEWVGKPIDGVTTPAVTITVQGHYEITANFELIPTYELTMAADPELGGTAIDVTDESPYAEGTQVSIRAEANLGYQFVNWTAPAGEFDNADKAETIFTMPGEAVTITANFELIPTYELTMAVSPLDSGTATDLTNEAPYAAGTNVSIKAEANEGYQFVNWTAPAGEFDNADEAETIFTMPGEDVTITANFAVKVEPMVAAGGYHTVGLQSNGTVVAVGNNESGQCDVGEWIDIVQVAAGGYHTVGLQLDGTLVAAGDDTHGQCDVGNWEDILQIAAGHPHTVGLKSDGTVVAVGDNTYGQCNVGDWEDITQITAGYYHTVGLKSDGTVLAVGLTLYGRCNVAEWEDITQVAAGEHHTVGLQSNGTVVAVGWNNDGQCSVGEWTDIVQVAAGALHTVGLQDNATVLAIGRTNEGQCGVGEWIDIVQVAAGGYHTVGLKGDGTVAAVGLDDNGQCAVSGWMLN